MENNNKNWVLPEGFWTEQRAWDSYLDRVDTIYLDLDDTLVPLSEKLLETFGKSPSCVDLITDYNNKLYEVCGVQKKNFWNIVANQGPEFWSSMELTAGGTALLDFCKYLEETRGIRWQIVTALVSDHHPRCRATAAAGKAAWAADRGLADRLTISNSKFAHAAPSKLLIDDCPERVEKFRHSGGHAVYFPQPWNVGTILKKMFDEIHAPRFMK